MSTERTDYIVYGWKLPYTIENKKGPIDLWDDKFLPYIEGHKGIDYIIVRDQICGKYTVFGLLVEREGEVGWDFTTLTLEEIDRGKLIETFEELFETKIPQEPLLFIFSAFH